MDPTAAKYIGAGIACMRPGTTARRAVAPIIRSVITASAISMNRAEFVNAISTPPILPKVKRFLIWNW